MSTSSDIPADVEKGIDQCDDESSGGVSEKMENVEKSDRERDKREMSDVEMNSVSSGKHTEQVDVDENVKGRSGGHRNKDRTADAKRVEHTASSGSHKSKSGDGNKHHTLSSTKQRSTKSNGESSSSSTGQSDFDQVVKEPSDVDEADRKKREHPDTVVESEKATESSKSSLTLKRARMQALVDDRTMRGLPTPNREPAQDEADEAGTSAKDKSSTTSSSFPSDVHSDLLLSKQLAYDPAGFIFTKKPVKDAECDEYFGYNFSLNSRNVKFRVAKTTPTKIGQFVTFWKRIGKGPIMPYDVKDPIDLFVVCVREGNRFGQFVFPKKVMALEDVVSSHGKGGKRAIRVYPPWVKTESGQAMKTQNWQVKHFVTFTDKPQTVNLERLKKLYAT